jgi:hypothetical protein
VCIGGRLPHQDCDQEEMGAVAPAARPVRTGTGRSDGTQPGLARPGGGEEPGGHAEPARFPITGCVASSVGTSGHARPVSVSGFSAIAAKGHGTCRHPRRPPRRLGPCRDSSRPGSGDGRRRSSDRVRRPLPGCGGQRRTVPHRSRPASPGRLPTRMSRADRHPGRQRPYTRPGPFEVAARVPGGRGDGARDGELAVMR